MERIKQGAHTSIGTGHAGVPNPESMFEWHDTRKLTTIEKHGIQFEDVGRIFASDLRVVRERTGEESARWRAERLQSS